MECDGGRKGLAGVDGEWEGVPNPGRLKRDDTRAATGAVHSPAGGKDPRDPCTLNMGFRGMSVMFKKNEVGIEELWKAPPSGSPVHSNLYVM